MLDGWTRFVPVFGLDFRDFDGQEGVYGWMDQDSGRGGDCGKITEVRRVYKWVPKTLETLDERPIICQRIHRFVLFQCRRMLLKYSSIEYEYLEAVLTLRAQALPSCHLEVLKLEGSQHRAGTFGP